MTVAGIAVGATRIVYLRSEYLSVMAQKAIDIARASMLNNQFWAQLFAFDIQIRVGGFICV